MVDVQVCAFHGNEGVPPVFLGDEAGSWEYTCPRSKGHPTDGPYTWISVPEPPEVPGLSGLANELNLYIKLPAVLALHRGHWVEYGVVERSFALSNPDDFAVLVDKYGHTAIRAQQFTVSAYLARTLGDLSRIGSVLYHPGPATGRWSYNSTISWWALPPAPDWSTSMSWAALGCSVDYVPGQVEE